MSDPKIITQLWCWIGTSPLGEERVLSVTSDEDGYRPLIFFAQGDALVVDFLANQILVMSCNTATPLTGVELRQFRMVTQ